VAGLSADIIRKPNAGKKIVKRFFGLFDCATVTWASGGFAARSVTISENLYRWVNDGSGAQ
jgi:hypothetical protein